MKINAEIEWEKLVIGNRVKVKTEIQLSIKEGYIMEGKSKTEYILEVIALIISGIGFVLFFTAGIMGFAKTD